MIFKISPQHFKVRLIAACGIKPGAVWGLAQYGASVWGWNCPAAAVSGFKRVLSTHGIPPHCYFGPVLPGVETPGRLCKAGVGLHQAAIAQVASVGDAELFCCLSSFIFAPSCSPVLCAHSSPGAAGRQRLLKAAWRSPGSGGLSGGAFLTAWTHWCPSGAAGFRHRPSGYPD